MESQGRIRLLPDGVVNQIAAGEVVERPASVLKELLENAVDAGGPSIDTAIGEPFPYTVRVSDRGCGMTRDEALLAVRRHTTSKIRDAEDLARIRTYGFRGEALPSIASVSRLRIVTRPPDAATATELVVEAGEILSVGEVGAPQGTTVEVSRLFENVPARRKFLKAPRTELTHLWEAFHGVALGSEGIAFRFDDGRGEFSYEAGETRLERALRHARDDRKYLVPVDATSPFFRLTGFAGLPQASRIGASGIFFFVNGRRFRDRGLFGAVREAYRGILPPERYPVVYLFVDCGPSEVDVNVHPAKTEARFRNARDLFAFVRHAIGEALGERTVSAPVPAGSVGERRREHPTPFPFPAPVPSPPAARPGRGPLFEEAAEGGGTAIPVAEFPSGRGFSAWTPVAQVLGTYIVCEGMGDLVIVDQHAASERITFSRLKEAYLGGRSPAQRWLAPKVLRLPSTDPQEREEIEAFLARAGFLFEREGDDAVRVTGGPAVLGAFDVERWWADFREFLSSREALPKGIFDADRELWRVACHASLRAGDRLDVNGMRALLRDLDAAVAAHSCPHGRPVWVRLSKNELGAMFRRT